MDHIFYISNITVIHNRTWVGAIPNASVVSNHAENYATNCILFGCVPAFV
jgi:hypothetical protein